MRPEETSDTLHFAGRSITGTWEGWQVAGVKGNAPAITTDECAFLTC